LRLALGFGMLAAQQNRETLESFAALADWKCLEQKG